MPRWLSLGLRWIAGAYLLGVWLDGTGSTLPSSVLPRAPNYFLQIAALFPMASTASIDYRAEGWTCTDHAWKELDTRPYFPIDRENKENRFERVMHFYRQERRTMHALDTFLVERHRAGDDDDGIPAREAIGGVRLSSLRIPIPKPGAALERPHRMPLAEYPPDEKHVFYHTPRSKIAERCGYPDVSSAPEPGASGPSDKSAPPEGPADKGAD